MANKYIFWENTMLKKIFAYTTIFLAITACSKQEKPADTEKPATASVVQATPTADNLTTTPASSTTDTLQPASIAEPQPMAEPNQPTAVAVPQTQAQPQIKTQQAPVPTKATKPSENANPAITPETAVSKPNEKPVENLALKADLNTLFKTINEIDQKHQAKQAELEQKMQSAQSPEDQKKIFDEVIKQLDTQKKTLQGLDFNEKRVSQVRDKMLKNIDETRKGMAIMAKNPEATPESHPEIGKTMQQADKTASEVRENIQKLVAEAGIDPNSAN